MEWDSKGNERVQYKIIPEVELKRWYQLGVKVKDGKVTAYLDGKVAFEYDGENKEAFDGAFGVISQEVKAEMKKLLKAIQDGSFAETWIGENKSGRGKFLAMRKEHAEHQMEQVGDKLRSMMPWIAKNRLVDRGKK